MFTLKGIDYETLIQCTLGERCIIPVTGTGLGATNEVSIFAGDQPCGEGTPILADFDNSPNPKRVENDGVFQTYDLSTPLLGIPGMYKLCFSFDPESAANPDYLNRFRFQVAPFKMVGPVQVAKFCYLSMNCNIPVTGTDLQGTNAMLFIDRQSNCGDLNPKLHLLNGQTNPKRTALIGLNNHTDDEYQTGVPYAGKPGINGKVCWGHSPSTLTNYQQYKVNLGFFSVYGPKQTIFRCQDHNVIGGTPITIGMVNAVAQISCTIITNEVVLAVRDKNDGGTYKVSLGNVPNCGGSQTPGARNSYPRLT